MVQSLLLFTLGFLVAALLGLLLAPLLWRRAQALMRRRLEALVPMTLDEVRADRDALRAEHAMAMRRLEMENEEIRQLDAVHLVEISRARETLKTRDNAIAERDRRLDDAKRLSERLAFNIRARERELAAAETGLRVASREIGAKREEIALLRAAKPSVHESAGEASAGKEPADGPQMTEPHVHGPPVPYDPPVAPMHAPPSEEGLDGKDVLLGALRAAETRVGELERDLRATDELLRGEMADLSARLVHLAVWAEGEASPLPALLDENPAHRENGSQSDLQARMIALIQAYEAQTDRTGNHSSGELPPMPSADPLERFVEGMEVEGMEGDVEKNGGDAAAEEVRHTG